MPENEKPEQKASDNFRRTPNRNQAPNPFGMLSSASPEELLVNLRRIENIVSEVSRLFRK